MGFCYRRLILWVSILVKNKKIIGITLLVSSVIPICLLREIRAQQVGISDTYCYLQGVFSDVDKQKIENVLLDYVDFVCSSDYFIDNGGVKFESLDDVDVAFDKAFERSKVVQRKYEINICDNVMNVMRYYDKYPFVIDAFQDYHKFSV